MLAYRFPPCTVSPTAAARAQGFASWLRDFAWDPVVLAPQIGSVCDCEGCAAAHGEEAGAYTPVRVPVRRRISGSRNPVGTPLSVRDLASSALRNPSRLRRAVSSALTDLEPISDWPRSAASVAESMLARRQVDAIWATAGPPSSLWAADRVARHSTLPWVADLRDSLALEWQLARDRNRPAAERLRHHKNRPVLLRTRRILGRASAVIEVTPQHATRDSQWLGRSCEVITSGFSPSVWDLDRPPRKPDHNSQLQIVCTGRLYPGLLTLGPALAGIRKLRDIDPGVPVRLIYYGRSHEIVRQDAARYGVEGVTECRGFIPPEQLREHLMAADILLLATTEYSGVPGGRLYEYLAARRPIFAVPGGDDFVNHVLQETGAGLSATGPEQVANVLRRWLDEWTRTGCVSYRGNAAAVNAYSIREGARRLAALLDAVVDDGASGRAS